MAIAEREEQQVPVLYRHECKRPNCGYVWWSQVEQPRVCTRCKSYKWNPPEGEEIRGRGRPRQEQPVP